MKRHVLYDTPSLQGAGRAAFDNRFDLRKVKAFVNKSRKTPATVCHTAYLQFESASHDSSGLEARLREVGFECVVKKGDRYSTVVPSMFADILDWVLELGDEDGELVLATARADFAKTIEVLQEWGVRVIVVGVQESMPAALINAATEVYYLTQRELMEVRDGD